MLFLVVDIYMVWRSLIELLLVLVVEFMRKLAIFLEPQHSSSTQLGLEATHVLITTLCQITMLNGDLYVTGNMLLSYGYTGGQGGG